MVRDVGYEGVKEIQVCTGTSLDVYILLSK